MPSFDHRNFDQSTTPHVVCASGEESCAPFDTASSASIGGSLTGSDFPIDRGVTAVRVVAGVHRCYADAGSRHIFRHVEHMDRCQQQTGQSRRLAPHVHSARRCRSLLTQPGCTESGRCTQAENLGLICCRRRMHLSGAGPTGCRLRPSAASSAVGLDVDCWSLLAATYSQSVLPQNCLDLPIFRADPTDGRHHFAMDWHRAAVAMAGRASMSGAGSASVASTSGSPSTIRRTATARRAPGEGLPIESCWPPAHPKPRDGARTYGQVDVLMVALHVALVQM